MGWKDVRKDKHPFSLHFILVYRIFHRLSLFLEKKSIFYWSSFISRYSYKLHQFICLTSSWIYWTYWRLRENGIQGIVWEFALVVQVGYGAQFGDHFFRIYRIIWNVRQSYFLESCINLAQWWLEYIVPVFSIMICIFNQWLFRTNKTVLVCFTGREKLLFVPRQLHVSHGWLTELEFPSGSSAQHLKVWRKKLRVSHSLRIYTDIVAHAYHRAESYSVLGQFFLQSVSYLFLSKLKICNTCMFRVDMENICQAYAPIRKEDRGLIGRSLLENVEMITVRCTSSCLFEYHLQWWTRPLAFCLE